FTPARQRIRAHLVRLEERAEPVVVLLTHGIVLVVVASTALKRHPQEAGRRVFHGVLEPDGAVKDIEVSPQIPGGPLHVRIPPRPPHPRGPPSPPPTFSRTSGSSPLPCLIDSMTQSRQRQICRRPLRSSLRPRLPYQSL